MRWKTDRVISYVAGRYGMRSDELLERTNRPAICRPRQAAMYLCHTRLGMSMPEIGRRFGLHHTTVVHAVHITRMRRRTDVELDALLEEFTVGERPEVEALRADAERLWLDVQRLGGAA